MQTPFTRAPPSGHHGAPAPLPPPAGVLLAVGLATTLLTGLGLALSPSMALAGPMGAGRPQWRGLCEPHVPTVCAPLRDR